MMANDAVTFERDIKPLFRQIDIDHMSGMDVMLDDYEYMSDEQNAQAVLEFLNGTRQPQMPPGGPFWSSEQLDLVSRWIAQGRKA
jgi:hypothetical protein